MGAVLAQPTDDRTSAYKILAGYLPSLELDAENTSDFLYRINRPRPSVSLVGANINRLNTWSALRATAFAVVRQMPEVQQELDLYITAQLELDINTTPESARVMDQASLSPLFDELLSVGFEIAMNGDVP